MNQRHWRVVVVPPGSGSSKVFEVSQNLVKLALGVGLVLVLATILLSYTTFSRTIAIAQHQGLVNENQVLARELGQLENHIIMLQDTLGTIQERSARIRLLANLDPVDPQVAAAGIGGPASTNVATEELRAAGVLGARTATVKVDLNAMIRRANLLASSFAEAADSLELHTARLAATPSVMPTSGWLISQFS